MTALVCFLAGLVGVVLTAAWASVRASGEARQAESRWGEEVADDRLEGAGPFRAARLVTHRPRGVPSIVYAAGASGVALGILWTLLVAPGTGLLAIFVGTEVRGVEWLGMATLFLAGWSFISGYFVYTTAAGLLRCERGVGERATRMGIVELVVCAARLLVYAAVLGPTAGPTLAAGFFFGPGALHGALMWAAGRRVFAIQTAMSVEERAALPEPEMDSVAGGRG